MSISYRNISMFIKPVFRNLHLYQLTNLILCVYGIAHAQSLQYAQIARCVPTDTSHHHTKKRIYRFMDNENIDVGLLMVYWCRFVVSLLYGFRQYVPVIVDITWVCGHKYLVAAVPFCCRAIPVAFRRFTDEDVRSCSSQNEIENDFFSWVRMTLMGYRVVVIADRGFRRASLIEFLRRLGLHYVIRVSGNVWISTHENARREHSGILGDIRLKTGQRIGIRNASYQKRLRVPTNLIPGKLESERVKKQRSKPGKKKRLEPWYIATDLHDLNKAYALYEQRMWVEEMFRDLKSRFHWCEYRVTSNRRREMLTFCLMVSYTILALLGYQVLKTNRASLVSSYGKSSIVWLGIGIINHRKQSASALFRQIRRRYGLVDHKKAA